MSLGVTRQQMLDKLQEAAALAKAKCEPMAMVAAWREIGKVCGFYQTERVKVEVDLVGSGITDRMENMSDSELLRVIAAGR